MFLFLDLWSRDLDHKNKYQNISPQFKNIIYILITENKKCKNKNINVILFVFAFKKKGDQRSHSE